MKVGIWGGGFVGGHLAAALALKGIDTCVLGRGGAIDERITASMPATRHMAFSDTEAEMVEAMTGLSVLVHCAGKATDGHGEYLSATMRMASAAALAGVGRVILLSTVAVYGAAIPDRGMAADVVIGKSVTPIPLTPYAQSRYAAEIEVRKILEAAGVEFAVVRIPMVVGAEMNATIFSRLNALLKFGFFPKLHSSESVLPCIGIERLQQCLAKIVLQSTPLAAVYQFADSVSWRDIVMLYVKSRGQRVRTVSLPGRALHWFAARAGLVRIAATLRSLMNTTRYEDDSGAVLAAKGDAPWPTILCVQRGLLGPRVVVPAAGAPASPIIRPLSPGQQAQRVSSSVPAAKTGINNGMPSRYPSTAVIFLLFFSYATAAALIFQNLLLPMVGGSHFGHGLIQGDSAYFHSVAVDLAERIRQEGWSAWRVYPTAGARGNAAVLAGLYALFGDNPSVMVPVNAALHALSGVLIMLLGRMLWPGRIGGVGSAVAACLFIAFPSALNWYGQIHKDGFAIAGTVLFLYAWFSVGHVRPSGRALLNISLLALAGVGLIVFVRPYSLKIVLSGVFVMFVAEGVLSLRQFSDRARRSMILKAGLIVSLAGCVALVTQIKDSEAIPYEGLSGATITAAQQDGLGMYRQKIAIWRWHKSDWVPSVLDYYAEGIARTRFGLIVSGLAEGAESLYDMDRIPDSTLALVAYVPRAIQISLFAPFPSKWFEKRSVARLVSVGEMLVWYLLAPGVLFALWYRRSPELLAVTAFALSLLAVYGLTLANVGSLYRIRYLYLFLLLLLGTMGWLAFFRARGWFAAVTTTENQKETGEPAQSPDNATPMRSELFGSGITVAVATAFTFMSLFLRDILMARMFGLSRELDAFVTATVGPMLLVSVFSIPIGTAIVPIFLATRQIESQAAAQALARRVAIVFFGSALLIAVVYLLVMPYLMERLWRIPEESLGLAHQITWWMLAIFVLSGLVTLANGMLNALGRYTLPTVAQMIVPVAAIAALLCFGKTFGVVVVVAASFIGQLVNLVLVYRALMSVGISFKPRSFVRERVRIREFLAQYFPLAVAAVFMQLAVPVGTAMAAALPEGNIAALGLGSKAVLFITGLVGAVVTTVVLPYFSAHLADNRLLDARRELSFLLLAGTVVTIPITLVLHVLAGPFVSFIFEGGAFGAAEGFTLSRVMAYGVLQLPFFVANLLLLKFAIATRCSGRVMFAALLGLIVNITLGFVLVDKFGVAGIALSITIAASASAGMMMLLFCRVGDVDVGDVIFIMTNWILFLAMAICIHYGSYPGFTAAALAFVLLLMGARAHTVKNHFKLRT